MCVALAAPQGAAAFSFPALATSRTSLSLRGSPAVNFRRAPLSGEVASVRGAGRRNLGVLALASVEGDVKGAEAFRFVDKRKEAMVVIPISDEVRCSKSSSSIAAIGPATTSTGSSIQAQLISLFGLTIRAHQLHLTESVDKVVLHKSIPAQIRQLILYIRNIEGQVDGCMGELTSARKIKRSARSAWRASRLSSTL